MGVNKVYVQKNIYDDIETSVVVDDSYKNEKDKRYSFKKLYENDRENDEEKTRGKSQHARYTSTSLSTRLVRHEDVSTWWDVQLDRGETTIIGHRKCHLTEEQLWIIRRST